MFLEGFDVPPSPRGLILTVCFAFSIAVTKETHNERVCSKLAYSFRDWSMIIMVGSMAGHGIGAVATRLNLIHKQEAKRVN